MLAKKHLVLLLSSCLCLSSLTGCGQSSSEITVKNYLEAYQAHNQRQMDSCLLDEGSLDMLKSIEGLPPSVIARYQTIFSDFSFDIEREEVTEDRASVYVKMTYKDAGTPSVEALHAYQEQAVVLDSNAVSESDIMALLEENFLEALNHNLEPIEEIIVVPLSKDASGNWKITLSWELQNALTANMGLMISELDYYTSETETPEE